MLVLIQVVESEVRVGGGVVAEMRQGCGFVGERGAGAAAEIEDGLGLVEFVGGFELG